MNLLPNEPIEMKRSPPINLTLGEQKENVTKKITKEAVWILSKAVISENIKIVWKLPRSKYMPVHSIDSILTQTRIDREYVFCAEATARSGSCQASGICCLSPEQKSEQFCLYKWVLFWYLVSETKISMFQHSVFFPLMFFPWQKSKQDKSLSVLFHFVLS